MKKPASSTPGQPVHRLKVTGDAVPPAHTPNHDDWLVEDELIEAPASEPNGLDPNAPGTDEKA